MKLWPKTIFFLQFITKNRPQGGPEPKTITNGSQGCMGEYGFDVLLKTPGLYQVPKLSNLKHLFKILPNLSKYVKTLYNKKVFAYFYSKIVVFGKFSSFPTNKWIPIIYENWKFLIGSGIKPFCCKRLFFSNFWPWKHQMQLKS